MNWLGQVIAFLIFVLIAIPFVWFIAGGINRYSLWQCYKRVYYHPVKRLFGK